MSATRADLTWRDRSSNETGITIERCAGARCTSFAQIATTSANTQSFSDSKVPGRGTYTYRVRALGAGGPSSYSNRAVVRTR